MADLTITVANVIAGTNARKKTGTAGATITAGQPVYLDPATNRYKLADCDDASADVRAAIGLSLHASLDGQPLTIIEGGDLGLGAILTAGVAYYLSATAGKIAPVGDLSTGDYPVLLGMAKTTSTLAVKIQRPGAVLA